MRLVAIETSQQTGSVALAEGGRVLEETAFTEGLQHGRDLIGALAELLGRHGWKPREFQAVAVDAGPGSYTGCRIGIVAAKLLAKGASAKLVGLSALEIIAAQAREAVPASPAVAALIDARRDQLYAALYTPSGDRLSAEWGPAQDSLSNVIPRIPAGTLLAGNGLTRFGDRFPDCPRAPSGAWEPRAATLAALAWKRLASGAVFDDLYALKPLYLKPTEAEEKCPPKTPQA